MPLFLPIQPPQRAESVRRAVRELKRGRLVVLPTDTVYGVAADPFAPGAEQRLFAAKQRDRGKPVALLAASVADVRRFGAELGPLARALAARFWPGALTLVLRVEAGWEGFRVPAHELTLEVLRAAGGLLRVSSANLSGDPPALTAREAVQRLGSEVAAALDAGCVGGGIASTVVRVENDRVEILREGALSRERIEAQCGRYGHGEGARVD